MRRDFLAALSFANLCYLRIWSELLTYRHSDTHLMTTPPRPVEYVALMVNVLLAALVFWGLGLLARRVLTGRSVRFAEMAVVLGLCIPLNALRSVLANQFPYLRSPLIELLGVGGVMTLGACLGIAGLLAVVFFHRGVSRGAIAVLAVLSPFCAATFGQAIWRAARYDASGFANNPPAPMIAGARSTPRVLWLIADEWDYRLTFVDRDATLKLPELDRLRHGSIFFDQAYPPGQETPVSMPGYYAGRLVDRVVYDGPRELQIAFKDHLDLEPWSKEPNVFERARQLGANTALAEWFYPTCRVLEGLSHCMWRPMAMQHNSMGDGFWEILPHQARSLFESNVLSLFGRPLTAEQQTGAYRAILGEAEKWSIDPDIAFTVVHLPIPHAPHVYNRETGKFSLGNSPIRGYVDSLALLDRTVGEIRGVMEKAGVWDGANVILTSDHPYREAEALDGKTDPRIPYMLKTSGQKDGLAYGCRFNTVRTSDLVLAILRGETGDATSAAQWLDAQCTVSEVH
jgi:hypothetical protein